MNKDNRDLDAIEMRDQIEADKMADEITRIDKIVEILQEHCTRRDGIDLIPSIIDSSEFNSIAQEINAHIETYVGEVEYAYECGKAVNAQTEPMNNTDKILAEFTKCMEGYVGGHSYPIELLKTILNAQEINALSDGEYDLQKARDVQTARLHGIPTGETDTEITKRENLRWLHRHEDATVSDRESRMINKIADWLDQREEE